MKYRLAVLAAALMPVAVGQSYDPKLFSELRWRSIGPFRGGRTRAAAGVPSQPNVFYIGAVDGGIWKTNDFGRTWNPIFDDQPTGSIGAIAIAPSDPNIIYVGSGEGLHRPDLSTGDGIYRSTDAGKTWTHLGLRGGQQIPQIAIDPRDPNRIFVAVLGHPYGRNEERGIFRSLDGGGSFQKVLYKDENTGGCDVAIDPSNPEIVYAGMWEAREGPWENAVWTGGGGLFKSTDGGTTWHALTAGLPPGVSQVNIAIAPSNPKRIYITAAVGRTVGIYRTDNGGELWGQTTKDPRPGTRIGGGDLPVLAVDPKNPDIVYSASIVTWKSTDGGTTWTGIRGAPGGDDYQRIWINTNNPDILLDVGDQGAIITVNGGETWSSWYNQPTAQMYHAAADNAFPYRLCSGQQESGSACVASRGNDGEITVREWHPAGLEEYGYAAPDPLDPDIVYGGKLTRYDRRTGQVQNVLPVPLRGPGFRVVRTQPVQFSPVDPHVLYFAANTLWRTSDGGHTWKQISPDLSRKTWEVPASVGKYRDSDTAKPAQRGVIYAIAPSPKDGHRIWAGTDDGTIHLTIDGGLHWKDVTPPQLVPWAKVSILDAGHFDTATAYAAINTLRLDDMRPHILRTHDSGATWTEIVNGIPGGAPVNVVREDPKRKGLLFAGTEREVYVSFDDGGHWQSLRLNMPATSVRDLIIKDDDLAVGTHGRGFWILDDITPLRQLTAAVTGSPAFLFAPETATRVRWDMNTDTPLPPDVPAGQNPPDGAVIDYYIGPGTTGSLILEILDGSGNLVQRYSDAPSGVPVDRMLPIPRYWVRPSRVLPADPGLHRWVWDMHYHPLPESRANYPMQAIVHNTPLAPSSPWVMPGRYTVKLIAGGKTYTQPLTVRMDPRVHTSAADLERQFTLSKQLYDDSARIGSRAGQDTELAKLNASLRRLMNQIQGADVVPTAAQATAVANLHGEVAKLLK